MKLGIYLVDDSLSLPKYQTSHSAGFDLYSRLDVTIQPKTTQLVPLNVILQLPQDHWVLMAARSSLHKKGVMLINGIGVGDYDFRGETDEYQAALYNFTDQIVEITKGERLVQVIILPREKAEFARLKKVKKEQSRGGFGSTGRFG